MLRHSQKSILFITGFVFLALNNAFAQDISLKSFVDRTRIATGQQFVLTIQISGSDALAAPVPELPDISSFANYVGSSTSSNYQLIMGKMSTQKSTANYYLAGAEGKFQIPAAVVTYRGKTFRSQPISIEIVKGSAPPATSPGRQRGSRTPGSQITPENAIEGNLFLKAHVDQQSVYQNEPLNVTYKIYTRVDVKNFVISELPAMLGFWSEEFSLPQQPVTYEEVIDGKRFLVAEVKKFALFPTDFGPKTVNPMAVECEVQVRQRRRSNDVIDRFFDDDFFGSGLFGQRIRKKLFSDSLKIDVKPLPEEGKPSDFSGAVGNFSMNATIDKDEVSANEAITLKVRLSGSGNIRMLSEPAVVFPPDLEIYEPKTNHNLNRSGNQISGTKTTEYVIIPRLAGEYRIKPFTFSYFNPDNGTYRTLRSPEFKILVKTDSRTGAAITSGISRAEIKLIGRDIRFIKENSSEYFRIGAYFYRSVWFGILILIPLFMFSAALLQRHKKDKMSGNVAYARSRRASQMAKKRLSLAFKFMNTEKHKDFYTEISNGLLGFVADKFNLAAAGLISDEVADRLRNRKVAEPVIAELMDCLRECDFQRFAPSGSILENKKDLYNRASAAIINLDKAKLG